MKFRVFDKKANKEIGGALVDGEGNVYTEGLGGLTPLNKKGLRIDLLVGFDENKNPIYENDLLALEYSSGRIIDDDVFVTFDGDRVWLSIRGNKLPLKEVGMKIYLKD